MFFIFLFLSMPLYGMEHRRLLSLSADHEEFDNNQIYNSDILNFNKAILIKQLIKNQP